MKKNESNDPNSPGLQPAAELQDEAEPASHSDKKPVFSLSQLRITPPQTPEDIRRAMAEGRFAEMTLRQAGCDED